MSPRPIRTLAGLTATLSMITASIALAALPASAEPAAEESPVNTTMCPGTPVWTGGFTSADENKEFHGKTSVKGSALDEFQGTYVDTIRDTYGNDIFLFDLAGSRITNGKGGQGPAGIWAGISGSPVYDSDNNLVGSVSYGFTDIAGSTLAGITPAENVINADPTAVAPTVRLNKAERSSLKAAGVEGAARLKTAEHLPLARVVVGSKKDAALATKAGKKSRQLTRRSGHKDVTLAAAGQAKISAPIEAGSNIATSYSWGQVTMASVGTVTAVCGDKVYAFGHSDEENGRSTQTILKAETATIVSNGGWSYKMVNVDTTPAGSLTSDNINGVSGTLGTVPTSTEVVTHTTANGTTTDRTSHVSTPYALSTMAYIQMANDAYNAFKKDDAGDALISWKINFTRENGKQETLNRTQRYSNDYSLPEEVGYGVADDIESLQTNSFENITIQKVDVTTKLLPDYRMFKVAGVQYKSGKTYKNVKRNGTIKVKAGSTVKFRVKLKAAPGSNVKATTVNVPWKTSKYSRGTAPVRFNGLAETWDEDAYFGEDDFAEPKSFDALVKAIKSEPREDYVHSKLTYKTKSQKKTKTKKVQATGLVTDSFPVKLSFKK